MSKDMLGIAVRKLVTLPDATFGLVCDFLEKLSDPDWVASSKRFLRKENPWEAVTSPELKIWRTIKLGTGLKTADDFIRAFNENGCRADDWADDWVEDVLNQPEFVVASQETDVDLVVLSGRELGFLKDATHKDIYVRAGKLGLTLCPAEVGPQLRLQYKYQPKDEELVIAMEPIADSNGDLGVFSVEHDGEGLGLYIYDGDPEDRWDAGRRWVFCRRRS